MNLPAVRITGIVLSSIVMFAANAYAQETRLQYKFTKGDVIRYREITQNDMSSDMMPAGGQKVYNEMFTSQTVQSVHPDGSAEIIQTIDSISTLLNGQQLSNPQTALLVHLPVRITVATTGKIRNVRPASDSADAAIKAAVEILRNQLMNQPSYPEKSVTPYVPWVDSATFSQASQMGLVQSNIKYTTMLQGVDTVAGTIVKVLERSVDVSGDIGDNAGTLKGTGTGNVYFSAELGKEIMSTMTLNQSIDMVTPQGPMSVAMKISTKRELLK